jgi:peptide/nickel transport system substrate-binding protein
VSAGLGRDPKTLIVAIYSNASDFDPASNNEQLGNLILFATTEGLVRANADNPDEFDPQLAERWEHNDDFTVWTFYLRKNAKFHDGTPVNAEAVKYSFTRLINIDLGMSYILSQFISDPEAQMVVKDEYTIEFRFDQPTPLLIDALSSGYGSYVISPSAIQANEKNGDMGHDWLQTHEAGSGAYQLTEYSPNEQFVLTRFDDWWGWEQWKEGTHFDKIILKVVPEESARRSLIEKGDIDLTFDFSVENLEALQKNPDLSVHLSPALYIQYFVLGKYGPLEDPRVRQALNYAFDYEGYVNGVNKGLFQRAISVLPSRLKCFDPNVFVYQTDLEKAKQLLEEAGIQPGLELRYVTEEGSSPSAAQILQAQLAKIGINLKIEQMDTSSYIGIFYGDVQWPERPEIMGWGWWPDYNDPTDWAWPLFHTDASGSGGGNAGFYSNPRVDEIIDTAPTITDKQKLCELYKEFQDIAVRQDPAWIPLIEPPDQAIIRKDILGYQDNPIYTFVFDFYKLTRAGGE